MWELFHLSIILQERNLHSHTLWPRIPQGVNKSWLQITNLNQCNSEEIFILPCISCLWEFTFVFSIFWSFISPHPVFNFSQIPHCKPPPPASFHIILFIFYSSWSSVTIAHIWVGCRASLWNMGQLWEPISRKKADSSYPETYASLYLF